MEEKDRQTEESDIKESLNWILKMTDEDIPESWKIHLPEGKATEESTTTAMAATSLTSIAPIAAASEELKNRNIKKKKQRNINFFFKDIRILEFERNLEALEKEKRLERQRLALR